jgi:hypothetical protein
MLHGVMMAHGACRRLFKSSEERVPDAAEQELADLVAVLSTGGPHRVTLTRIDK